MVNSMVNYLVMLLVIPMGNCLVMMLVIPMGNYLVMLLVIPMGNYLVMLLVNLMGNYLVMLLVNSPVPSSSLVIPSLLSPVLLSVSEPEDKNFVAGYPIDLFLQT